MRKKKLPVTASDGFASSKRASSRKVIRRFHVLLKEKAKLPDKARLAEIDAELASLGDLPVYQQMSAIGQGNDRGGGSHEIFISWLKEEGLEKGCKLKLLEVGALKPDNYKSCASWLEVTPIDLHSRHRDIIQQDFLELSPEPSWDLVSLSLVLNFVPNSADRGRMLRLAHEILVPGGLLYLALPLPCVQNSRYLDDSRLALLMKAIGFIEVKSRSRQGGKMAYWLYRKTIAEHVSVDLGKKKILRQGNRNNFTILLR